MNDPVKQFYLLGFSDVKKGKKSRVPQNFKLAYANGRYDAVTGNGPRYGQQPERNKS